MQFILFNYQLIKDEQNSPKDENNYLLNVDVFLPLIWLPDILLSYNELYINYKYNRLLYTQLKCQASCEGDTFHYLGRTGTNLRNPVKEWNAYLVFQVQYIFIFIHGTLSILEHTGTYIVSWISEKIAINVP